MSDKLKLHIKNFAQISNAEIDFGAPGDLTILVGQQATGKSLVVQWLKLVTDHAAICADWERYSTNWSPDKKNKDYSRPLNAFFGEGMASGFEESTVIKLNGRNMSLDTLFKVSKKSAPQEKIPTTTFVVPAHRALLFYNGWPENFQQPVDGTPYVARALSENLARYLQNEGDSLFPIKKRLTEELRDQFDEAVFHKAKINVDKKTNQKRMVLDAKSSTVPYMAWTAGQREFTPLLFALYQLIPSAAKTKDPDIETVVIEEPELGLHPRALFAIGIAILHLMHRGYRVVVTSHSPLMMDFAWAINRLRVASAENKAKNRDYYEAFAMKAKAPNPEIVDSLKSKKARVYYLEYQKIGNNSDAKKVTSVDISHLKTYSENNTSVWGDLLKYSYMMAEVIGQLNIDFSAKTDKELL